MGTALVDLVAEQRKVEEAVSRGVVHLNHVHDGWFVMLSEHYGFSYFFFEMKHDLLNWGDVRLGDLAYYGLAPSGALLVDPELEHRALLHEWRRRALRRRAAYERLKKVYDRRDRRRRREAKAARERELQQILLRLLRKLHD